MVRYLRFGLPGMAMLGAYFAALVVGRLMGLGEWWEPFVGGVTVGACTTWKIMEDEKTRHEI